ncbi:MAG: DUF5666 domain-containing protein [Thermoanaerobaculia bacterium]
MKRIGRIFFLAAALLALGACENERLITGSFGQQVLTGQVTMAGELAGTSAAGVEVSVPGTGMQTVLGEDGRFIFSGVPADVVLEFRRAGDGVNAAYRASAREGSNVTIALSRSDARRVGRARPLFAGRGNGPSVQIEGTILEVTETSILVDAAGKGPTLSLIDEDTYIRSGNLQLTTADLAVGDRVHVKSQQAGEDLVAVQIVLQVDEPEEQEPKTELEGLLLTVSPEEIEVDAAGVGPTTVALNEETVIRKGNRLLEPEELEQGWRVHVRAVEGEDGLVAVLIIVQNMNSDDGDGSGEVQLEGVLEDVGDESITVNAAGRGSTVVLVDEDTVVRQGGTELTLADLEAGDRVHVKAREEGEELIAREIRLQNPA